jgi:recombination protein RecA
LQARLMSQALRKLSGAIKQSNTVMIFTNQLRMKIGIMFGSPETTSGGRALKFYASVRLDVRRIASIKQKGEIIGHRTRVRVTKNKVAPPFRVAEFDIMFGEGISHEGDLLDVGLDLGILDKRGSYYYYDGDNIAQGRENTKTHFQENPEFATKLEQLIREKLIEMNEIPLEMAARDEIDTGDDTDYDDEDLDG